MTGVSVITPTYARADDPRQFSLLCEAVECYRRAADHYQGPSEMVVLSDCRDQMLVCSVPGVRVVNVRDRFPTLGEKYNALVELTRYPVIVVAEDDDLFLKGRLTQAAGRLSSAGYFNPQRTWLYSKGPAGPGARLGLRWDHTHGVCHGSSAYTRGAWEAVGGYAALTGKNDVDMDHRLKAAVPVSPPLRHRALADWQSIYRWGVSPVHLSGARSPERLWEEHGNRPHAGGVFDVRPAWAEDYQELTERATRDA